MRGKLGTLVRNDNSWNAVKLEKMKNQEVFWSRR